MKKSLFGAVFALFFVACTADKNDTEIIKANLINLALQSQLNPQLQDEQINCIEKKNASSCLNIANALTRGSASEQSIRVATYYYDLACLLGLNLGCDRAKSLGRY